MQITPSPNPPQPRSPARLSASAPRASSGQSILGVSKAWARKQKRAQPRASFSRGVFSLAASALSWRKIEENTKMVQGTRGREQERAGDRHPQGAGSHASRPLWLRCSNRSTHPVVKRRRGVASSPAPVHSLHRGRDGPGGSSCAGGAGWCPGKPHEPLPLLTASPPLLFLSFPAFPRSVGLLHPCPPRGGNSLPVSKMAKNQT